MVRRLGVDPKVGSSLSLITPIGLKPHPFTSLKQFNLYNISRTWKPSLNLLRKIQCGDALCEARLYCVTVLCMNNGFAERLIRVQGMWLPSPRTKVLRHWKVKRRNLTSAMSNTH